MRLIVVVLFLLLASCGNKIFIVRHAQKAALPVEATAEEKRDPPLSDNGRQRANDLELRLKKEKIKQIFSTSFKRAIATAEPTAFGNNIGLITIYNANDSIDHFIQKLKEIQNENILVVGHSNTVDDIVNKLCGKKVLLADLESTTFNKLFILTRRGKNYRFKVEQYGAPAN